MIEVFAQRLKQARQVIGLTQEALAEKSGVSYNTIYFLERARNLPNLYTAILLADALNVSLDWLTGRSSYETKEA